VLKQKEKIKEKTFLVIDVVFKYFDVKLAVREEQRRRGRAPNCLKKREGSDENERHVGAFKSRCKI